MSEQRIEKLEHQLKLEITKLLERVQELEEAVNRIESRIGNHANWLSDISSEVTAKRGVL